MEETSKFQVQRKFIKWNQNYEKKIFKNRRKTAKKLLEDKYLGIQETSKLWGVSKELLITNQYHEKLRRIWKKLENTLNAQTFSYRRDFKAMRCSDEWLITIWNAMKC